MEKSEYIYNFINLMFQHFLQPCIVEPTRIIDGNRPSLIDNIFINSIEKNITSGNILDKITDHMPNFISVNNYIIKNKKIIKKIRNFKNFDEKEYQKDLNSINIKSLLNGNNIDEIYDHFHKEFLNITNKHAPHKYLTHKEIKWHVKPWLTKGLQKP